MVTTTCFYIRLLSLSIESFLSREGTHWFFSKVWYFGDGLFLRACGKRVFQRFTSWKTWLLAWILAFWAYALSSRRCFVDLFFKHQSILAKAFKGKLFLHFHVDLLFNILPNNSTLNFLFKSICDSIAQSKLLKSHLIKSTIFLLFVEQRLDNNGLLCGLLILWIAGHNRLGNLHIWIF